MKGSAMSKNTDIKILKENLNKFLLKEMYHFSTAKYKKDNDKEIDAIVFYTDDEANRFLETHPNYRVIGVEGEKKYGNPIYEKPYKIFVAKKND